MVKNSLFCHFSDQFLARFCTNYFMEFMSPTLKPRDLRRYPCTTWFPTAPEMSPKSVTF